MVVSDNYTIKDRLEAACLLAGRLTAYRDHNSIVVGIPCGGVVVGYHLARLLKLPLEIVQGEIIKSPCDQHHSIGSVSENNVSIHDEPHDIPQDYVQHQVMMLKNRIELKQRLYRGNRKPMSLKGKAVMLIDDQLDFADVMWSCIQTLRRQNPEKIIVAVPVTTNAAYCELVNEVDDFIFLFKLDDQGCYLYEEFSPVSDEEVKEMYAEANKFFCSDS